MEHRAVLMTMNLDRQSIDVESQVLRQFTMLQRGQTPHHQSQQVLVHGIDVDVAPEADQKPRQGGLGRPILGKRNHPARIAAGQLPEWAIPQRIGIAEIDPAHRPLKHQGSQLAGQRMTGAQRRARINEVIFECLDHAAVVGGFTQQQRTAVTGSSLAAQFDTDRAVARRRPSG